MFSGIIQTLGTVQSLGSGRLELEAREGLPGGCVAAGESIAVNGCCLTALQDAPVGAAIQFDLSPETLNRTALSDLGPGAEVNLERAMALNALLGGHLVQGHVDTTGLILDVREEENSFVYRFQVSSGEDRYLIDKGSIAVDGVSLTVVGPSSGLFEAWLIPHTLGHTNLGRRKAGDRVNLEFDVIAKYVEKLLRPRILA